MEADGQGNQLTMKNLALLVLSKELHQNLQALVIHKLELMSRV